MIFDWLQNRRRDRLLAEPFPPAWLAFLASNVRHYLHLPPPDQEWVRTFVQVFVAEKTGMAGRGLQADRRDEGHGRRTGLLADPGPGGALLFRPRRHSLILYAKIPFRPAKRGRVRGSSRKICTSRARRGSTVRIVLSWEDVLACGRNEQRGRNVVLHEFTHHLDDLDGGFDGASRR